MRRYLQVTALIVAILASATASLVMIRFSCYATVCPEDYFSFEARLHVVIYYCFLSLTLCLLALRLYSPAFRSFTNIRLLAGVRLVGKRFTLGETFMAIWILVITLGPTIYWFPTHWDFWGRRLDGLGWISAKIQLTITGITGHYADVLLGLLIIPVSRNSLVGQAFSVHRGTLLFAHRIIAYLFSIAVAAHGITYIVYATDGSSEGDKAKEEALATGNPTMTLSESKQGSSWFVQTTYTGIAAFLPISAILVASLQYIRRQHYNLFYYTHVICGIIIFVASCIHASTDFYLLLPGLLLWIGDWGRRVFFGETNGLRRKTVATLENAGGSWIRISLPAKGTPQQMMEKPVPTSEPLLYYHLNAPAVSKFQIHAFTAAVTASTSHGPRFLIQRASGKPQMRLDKEWTWKLGALVPNIQDSRDLEVRLEGPYPINDTGYMKASHILCIVGGTGVTGALSLARWWLDARPANSRFALIWTVRTRDSLEITEWTDPVDVATTNRSLEIRSHISSENGRLDTALILRDAFEAHNVMAADARGDGWVYGAGPDALVKVTEQSCIEVRKDLKRSRKSGHQGTCALKDLSWYIEA
ncbi:ferric reductase [Fusarium pseudoanthophilum]|uniref:Ferric reductase n=1 Tax=Fusarium pseudoanthophilum TaxID=48495 RepID=A0A8H5P898_9HYPO|nr:ferric reductase [Fusarium pseudoanthophilum]